MLLDNTISRFAEQIFCFLGLTDPSGAAGNPLKNYPTNYLSTRPLFVANSTEEKQIIGSEESEEEIWVKCCSTNTSCKKD